VALRAGRGVVTVDVLHTHTVRHVCIGHQVTALPKIKIAHTGFIMHGDLLRLQPAKRPFACIFVAAVNDAVV
jgi:hypothetical protein